MATRTSISILRQARTSTRVERPRQTQGHTTQTRPPAPRGHACTHKSRRRPVPDEDKPPPLLSAQCRHTAVATCHVCASPGSMRPCSSSSSGRVVVVVEWTVDWYPGGDRDGARPWHRRPPRGVDPSLGRQACSWIPRLHGHPSLPHWHPCAPACARAVSWSWCMHPIGRGCAPQIVFMRRDRWGARWRSLMCCK